MASRSGKPWTPPGRASIDEPAAHGWTYGTDHRKNGGRTPGEADDPHAELFSTVEYSDLSVPTLATQTPPMFVGAATVGLSIRSSAELGAFGKLLLPILFMFVGGLGPITFLVALSSRSDYYPPGNIAVG